MALKSEEPRGTTLSLDYRPLHKQQQQQDKQNNTASRMSAYSSQKHFSKDQFGKSLQQSLLSPQLQKQVIDDPLEDLVDADEAESILKKRNEHVNQMIDSLFSAKKNDDLDAEPVRQKSLVESLKFNKSPSKASLSKIIQQKRPQDWLETPLMTDISKRPYMNTISYLSDKGPNRASSPHLEFLPVKDTSKNEYNIDEYLPQKSFLKTTENQLLTNTLMSSFANQNSLERSKQPDTASFTKQSILERPSTIPQNRTNILKTNLSDTVVGQRATSPYRNRISSPDSKKIGYNDRKEQDLRFLFENILRQYKIQENPQLVANLLLSTVTQYRDQDSQSVHSRLNTENERSQYRGNTYNNRGGHRWANNLDFERTNSIEYLPAGRNYQARVIVHPGSKRTESDQLSFQAENNYAQRRTEESFRSNERPTWQEYVSPKSTNILNKQLSPSRSGNLNPYESIKIRDDSQGVSRNGQNKSGSKHRRYPSSLQGRRLDKTSPQRDENAGYKNIRANIENSFLESLQQSHQKFSSHLKHRVENLKTEGSTAPLAELNKLNSPNADALKVSELRKNISPSASAAASQYNNNSKTIPRSPTHMFNKSQRSQNENKENQNFDQTRQGASLRKSGFEKSPMRSVNSEYKKKWTYVKFFENEDLDLLIKSYI